MFPKRFKTAVLTMESLRELDEIDSNSIVESLGIEPDMLDRQDTISVEQLMSAEDIFVESGDVSPEER